VYFASGQSWDVLNGPKKVTKALSLLENPLFGLVEILSEASVTLNEPGAIEHVLV
jgi:hypothetical protein